MDAKRILYIALAILLGALLIDSGARVAGFLTEVSTGLTIHTSPENAVIDAPGEVRFDYTVLTPPLCSAQCEATLIRHDTNEVVAKTSPNVIPSGSISATIQGESSLKRVPVQLILTCKTQETRYCASNEQVSADLAIVRFTLDEDQEAIRDWLIENRERVRTQMEETRALLVALSELGSPYDTIARTAREELASYDRDLERFIGSIGNETYSYPPAVPDTIAVWNAEVEALASANLQSTLVAQRINELIGYQGILEEDRERFIELSDQYASVEGTPLAMIAQLETIGEAIQHITISHKEKILTRSWSSAHETHRTLRAACTLYDTPCPEAITRPHTIEEATHLNAQMCASVRAIRTSDPRAAYARSLNLTLTDAIEHYNVSQIRDREGFSSFERETIESASNGSLGNLSIGERLAITIPYRASYCASHIPTRTIELPSLSLESNTVPFDIPGERTCSLGSCDRAPAPTILFIHGHSFAESTDPRYNLQGMTRLAYAFEEHGYLYAGHLFPNSARDIGWFDAPVSFTATYYVNSYEEEGEIRLRTFKSEPIEIYAIRLREDIEEAVRLTGNDRVILVAHSMGGLVARSYLDLFGTDQVERLIMIGTPNHGIADRTERLCPVLGASLECRDMNKGSVFLRRLNSQPLPEIPITIIAGTGCDGGDGVVDLENALLEGVRTVLIEGRCTGLETVHGSLIDPRKHPETVAIIASEIGR